MAIISVADIRYRKFSGFDDPQYPSGYWLGDGEVTGDATGGTMTVQIDFAKVTDLFNSQYYSLEELMVDLDEGTSDTMGFSITNLDISSVLTALRYSVQVASNQGSRAGIRGDNLPAMLPLFLGQQSNANSAASISLIRTNADTDVIGIRIGGYVWSARSTSVSGGPQRPPTGLYRA